MPILRFATCYRTSGRRASLANLQIEACHKALRARRDPTRAALLILLACDPLAARRAVPSAHTGRDRHARQGGDNLWLARSEGRGDSFAGSLCRIYAYPSSFILYILYT